jgi:hypothetical protein
MMRFVAAPNLQHKGHSYLIESLQLFAGLGPAVMADQFGRVPIRHVALEAFLTLEEDLALVAPKQADIVHLPKAKKNMESGKMVFSTYCPVYAGKQIKLFA